MKVKTQQTPLPAIKKSGDDFSDLSDDMVQKPIGRHNPVLHSVPDGCRDQPEWGHQHTKTGEWGV